MITVSPREAYGLLAPEYDAHPNPLVSLEQRMMAPLLPQLSGRRVIDCAAGTGRWAAYTAKRGARSIAVDFSHEMLSYSLQPTVLGDLQRLPLRDACSDVTICAFAFGYSPGCLRELRRITRPGGTLLVSDIHPEAIRRGWTRSFRHSTGVIHIQHEQYQLEDLDVPGLELTCLLEPKFGAPERDIFFQAGRPQYFEEARQEPAIFIAKWTRRR